MFEHVGRDQPRRQRGFDGSRIILALAAMGIGVAGLFLLRNLGRHAVRAFLGPPVEVVYLPAEELPEGTLPGANPAAPLPDPPVAAETSAGSSTGSDSRVD